MRFLIGNREYTRLKKISKTIWAVYSSAHLPLPVSLGVFSSRIGPPYNGLKSWVYSCRAFLAITNFNNYTNSGHKDYFRQLLIAVFIQIAWRRVRKYYYYSVYLKNSCKKLKPSEYFQLLVVFRFLCLSYDMSSSKGSCEIK